MVARNVRLFSAYTGITKREIASHLFQHESGIGRKFKSKTIWTLKDIDGLCELFGLSPYDFFAENPDLGKIDVEEVKRKSAPGGVRTHDQRIMSPLL